MRDNTAGRAKELWSAEALALEPAEFQARLDAMYAATEGPATLWQLGGAANDYLRHHPASIQVPEALAPALLKSNLVDGRIIGLKLLTRLSSDVDAIAAAICDALQSRHQGVLYGGLCELGNLLRRLGRPLMLHTGMLERCLEDLASSRDPYVRESAQRYGEWIQECEPR